MRPASITPAGITTTEDPDEATIVLDIKKIYVITDAIGNIDSRTASTHDPRDLHHLRRYRRGRHRRSKHRSPKRSPRQKPGRLFRRAQRLARASVTRSAPASFTPRDTGRRSMSRSERRWRRMSRVLREFTLVLRGDHSRRARPRLVARLVHGRPRAQARCWTWRRPRSASPAPTSACAFRRARPDDELDYLILTFNRMIERLQASLPADEAVLGRRLARAAHAHHRDPRPARSGARSPPRPPTNTARRCSTRCRISTACRRSCARCCCSRRPSRGQLVLQKIAAQSLRGRASDLVDQFQIPAEEAGVRLTAELPAECAAEVDRVQIERMITNLLSNALKFTPRRRRRAGVVRRSQTEIEIDGGGYRPRHPDRAPAAHFRPLLSRARKARRPGPDQGLGLGLSFVAWIVKAHNGKIDVASTPAKAPASRSHCRTSGVRLPARGRRVVGSPRSQPIEARQVKDDRQFTNKDSASRS